MLPLEKATSFGLIDQHAPAGALPLNKPLKPLQREETVARPLR